MHSSTCEAVAAALQVLLRSNGADYLNAGVRVSWISDGGPPAYVIKPETACSAILAQQLTRITGRVFFACAPTFVLFDDNIQPIFNAANRCLNGPSTGSPIQERAGVQGLSAAVDRETGADLVDATLVVDVTPSDPVVPNASI